MTKAMHCRDPADLGNGGKLNEKLGEWWLLPDVSALRTEVKKAFKTDLPLAERDEWDKYLAAQRAKHQQMTDEIVSLETHMNAIVYDVFKLTGRKLALMNT